MKKFTYCPAIGAHQQTLVTETIQDLAINLAEIGLKRGFGDCGTP